MSYHHHADERARGPVNDGPQLPSFRDLVAFRSHNGSLRVDQGSEPTRIQRKEYIVDRSPRQHPEESFEIVGVKCASIQTHRLNTVQPQPDPRYDHQYRERTPRQLEKAMPVHDHRGRDQGHEHPYFSQKAYVGHQLPQTPKESGYRNRASHVNDHAKTEYRPEREAMSLHRHEPRQDPGRFSHPQHRHDGRHSPPRYPQERSSNFVDQAHYHDQVRPGYRKEERYPQGVVTVDPRRREASTLQGSHPVQTRSQRERDTPQYSPAPNRGQAAALHQDVKTGSERSGTVTTLNDLRRLRNDIDRLRHAPTNTRHFETVSHSAFYMQDDARHGIEYQPQVHRQQAEIELRPSRQQGDQSKSHQKQNSIGYDHRAIDPRDRSEAGYFRASYPHSGSQVYSASTHDGVREAKNHRLGQDGSKHFAPDRAPRMVYPPLPALSSSDGLRRAPSQTLASSTGVRTPDAFARPRPLTNGHSMHRIVSQSQRPTEAASAVAASRHQARLEEPRHVPHHPPHPRDQHTPSSSALERRNGRADHPHPVIASQHTGIRPSVEADLQRPSREMHAPSRPFKRQRAGSDTSLVLKSTRLTVADAEAELHISASSRAMLPTRQSEK